MTLMLHQATLTMAEFCNMPSLVSCLFVELLNKDPMPTVFEPIVGSGRWMCTQPSLSKMPVTSTEVVSSSGQAALTKFYSLGSLQTPYIYFS